MPSIVEEAKKKYERIARIRQFKRFQRVMGRLIASKLLYSNEAFKLTYSKIPLRDFLWAGEIEPRIFEVLPALILKRPSLVEGLENCPTSLRQLLDAIRKGNPTEDFHGIPPKNYLRWITHVGHKGLQPTLTKSFRLRPEDLKRLALLKQHGYSEAAAVREGLSLLCATLDTPSGT